MDDLRSWVDAAFFWPGNGVLKKNLFLAFNKFKEEYPEENCFKVALSNLHDPINKKYLHGVIDFIEREENKTYAYHGVLFIKKALENQKVTKEFLLELCKFMDNKTVVNLINKICERF